MGALRFILALAGILILVTIGVKNMHPVTVGFYGLPGRTMPLFYLLLIAFTLGALLAWLFHLAEKIRLQWKLRREQIDLRKLREQVQEMEERSLVPIHDGSGDIEPSYQVEVDSTRNSSTAQ